MKKAFSLILILFFVITADAQNATAQKRPGNSAVKEMTVEEANRLNGTANPTINGKPYSQYKAEQEALKKQEAQNAVATPASTPLKITSSSQAAAPAPKIEGPKPEAAPKESAKPEKGNG